MRPLLVSLLVLVLLPLGCRSTPAADEAELLRRRAVIAQAQGRWLQAGDAWNRILKASDGRDAEAALGLAQALAAQGDRQGALAVLAGARRRGVADAPLLFDLAGRLAALERTEEALEAYREASAKDPAWAAPAREAGVLAAELGRRDAALADLRAAASRDPDDRRTWLWLARTAAAAGERDEALEAWRACFAAGEPDVDLEVELVLEAAELVRGREDEADDVWLERAAAWLESARRDDPQSSEAHRALADLRLAQGRPAEALEPLRRAVETDPGDLGSLLRLAELRARAGERERVEALVAHALEVTDDPAERAPFLELRERLAEPAEGEEEP